MTLFEAFLNSSAVTTDTRSIPEGSIFFGLKGARFNGNDFALQALKLGAKYAVIDEMVGEDDRLILVDNVLEALQNCARAYRRYLGIPIVGLTGSNGKTTNKELFQAVLNTTFKTSATAGNLNNHIGVPLSLLRIPRDSELAVIEMGANHQKEIAKLAAICEPTIGYITNYGKAHLEGFGGVEGIIKGKSELYDYLGSSDGLAMVNLNDPIQIEKSEGINQFGYGKREGLIQWSPSSTTEFAGVHIVHREESYSIQSQLSGSFNEQNIVAAACLGHHMGVDAKAIKSAIESYAPSMNRMEWRQTAANKVLLDAYNANPTSMKLSVESFAAWHKQDGLLVLGDMFELGEESGAEHQAIVNYIRERKLEDQTLLVGKHFGATNWSGLQFSTTEKLANYWKEKGAPQDASVLLKGSRGIALEKLLLLL
ncbi:MAG TPA: UDP-N-acetylmuramoyl-tripeptide--D-alanyl-D-alanine ligase [Cryomorphaceae bacterium]|nr:UDP-N-acetylmuramoyl-tripeptide--D-alanyl-D-alanine ligase [Cryomorphaceae bacterium]